MARSGLGNGRANGSENGKNLGLAWRSIGGPWRSRVSPWWHRLPPVSPTCITSPFGPRVLANRPIAGTFHYGIDLRAPLGTAVRAITAGQIVGIDRRGAGGLEVRVQHPGFVALYAHLGSLAPALLQGRRKLNAGEKIAVVGYSGLTFGPHLYFELIIDGHRVDPAPYLIVSPCPR